MNIKRREERTRKPGGQKRESVNGMTGRPKWPRGKGKTGQGEFGLSTIIFASTLGLSGTGALILHHIRRSRQGSGLQ